MSEERVAVPRDIPDRTIAYSLRIIKLCRELEKTNTGRILGKQLLRAGTSIGANVHEAQGAQSKADFIAKMSIAHKEAREASYWLTLVSKAALVSPNRPEDLSNETGQLIKILSAILLSAKKSSRR